MMLTTCGQWFKLAATGASALGSFLVCAGSGLWAICVRPAYPSTTAWLPILAISFCLGFLEAIEDVSMVFATRHIPATHVAMLMNLDVIIGPLLAVAAFGEYPTLLTVVVCIIVITV